MTDRRQRQKDQRTQRREEERRAATRKEFRRRIVIAIGVGVGLAGVLLLTNLDSGSEAELPEGLAGFRTQPTACEAETPSAWVPQTFLEPADQGTLPETATIETSCGPIVIALNPEAPDTVNSFVFLASEGFYDGLVFNRVLDNFAIYGGDPDANGGGTPGYVIPDEPPPDGFVYEEGTVAMASTGSGTSGSYFFIVSGPDARVLTNRFAVLGTVTEGQDTVSRIAALELIQGPGNAGRTRPAETVYIESVTFGP